YAVDESFSVAGGNCLPVSGRTSSLIQSLKYPDKAFHIDAHILQEITADLPNQPNDIQDWNHLVKVPLADPEFSLPGPIHVVLGIPVIDRLFRRRMVRGERGTPSAYSTDLGYIVMGPIPAQPANQVLTVYPSKQLEFNIDNFGNIEEIPMRNALTEQEQICETHYKINTLRLDNCQYQVRWPFKPEHLELGSSRESATSSWMSVEKKILRSPEARASYHPQLQEYLDFNQTEEVPPAELNKTPSY
ncbi:unnamed protein product, partial [Allacma fusca]